MGMRVPSADAKPLSRLVIVNFLWCTKTSTTSSASFWARLDRWRMDLGGDLVASNPLEHLDVKFVGYRGAPPTKFAAGEQVAQQGRRADHAGRNEVPGVDGSTTPVIEVVRSVTLLFAAGQETATKLLSASIKVLGNRPDIRAALRKDRSRIPIFVEESRRTDAPVESQCRLTRELASR